MLHKTLAGAFAPVEQAIAQGRIPGAVLGVVIASVLVAIGLPRADPVVGLVITALILRITWQAWRTIRSGHTH